MDGPLVVQYLQKLKERVETKEITAGTKVITEESLSGYL
jgi:hypothetical protein